ncbi:putative thymidylate synthase [Grosmannia clavigera kw1407]|uniref:Putative thymidylate synthase n=1 Tax=Grosmannia clavigera (strain kw1407 / UAMH 11150) TaxID=655863 RepID=F0XNR4_GROCL|nr:putative thymidylate synthase [Grosmannia clavigera kw1407]EFX00084.1 putative thymidylate synthase [Grosmannia clavigera kw1407]
MAAASQINAPAALTKLSPAAEVASTLNDGKTHLLLAASGSVATIKLPLIAAALGNVPNLSIRILLTDNAARFLAGQSAEQPPVAQLAAMPHVASVHRDADEWSPPWVRDAHILHIELRRWADLLVIAPMSANLLAKVTNGFCDSLLTSVIRAWDTDPAAGKRILVAPSMNTLMWTHPLTARQLTTLRDAWGTATAAATAGDGATINSASVTSWFEVLLPQRCVNHSPLFDLSTAKQNHSKALACGDVGQGAMADWRDIVQIIRDRLSLSSSKKENST